MTGDNSGCSARRPRATAAWSAGVWSGWVPGEVEGSSGVVVVVEVEEEEAVLEVGVWGSDRKSVV